MSPLVRDSYEGETAGEVMRVTIVFITQETRDLSVLNVSRLCQIVLLTRLNKSKSNFLSKPPQFLKKKSLLFGRFSGYARL
jgi:hypothetical protein